MDESLTDRYYAALREPLLEIHLDRNHLFGHQPLIRLMKPGATARSKPVQLLPVLVGVDGQTHADMLRHLAEAIEQANA